MNTTISANNLNRHMNSIVSTLISLAVELKVNEYFYEAL